jgi:hypothetical protein
MESEELADAIFEIVNLLEKNDAIALFAKEEWGFEKWLQVELCWILNKYGTVLPERNHIIDIVFDDEWAISLKDRKTKFYDGRSPIFKNLNDLNDEPYSNYNKACLVFLTFPSIDMTKDNKLISTELNNHHKIYFHKDFNFKNDIEGRIWLIVR